MHPLLFEIPGGIRIYTYGVLVALAFLVGIFFASREARIAGANADRVVDLSFYIVLSALVGSRILYIFGEWQRYLAHPLEVLKIWEGGLVFYGGFLGAFLATLLYVRKHKINFLQTADFFVVGLALGHAIGRLGCFAAGCCYGRETSSFLSIVFPSNRFSLAPPGIPLFPSQLFESAASLLIFFVLVLIRKKKRFNGQIFLIYIVLTGLSRSVLEVFRGNASRSFIVPDLISVSQLISGFFIVMSFFIYRRLRKTKCLFFSFLAAAIAFSGCYRVVVHSRDRPMEPVSQLYAASVDEAFKAGKEALLKLGYKIDRENAGQGTLRTGWQSAKATSHYVDLFDRRDYGTVSAYYRIHLHVREEGHKAEVDVSAPVRSITGRIKSSHEEEERILKKIGDLLRREEFEITNVGVEE